MRPKQQELPFRTWGGARKGAGRKRRGPKKNVPHRRRRRFRKSALHVTTRVRQEVWNLRSHRCFRAMRRAFERGPPLVAEAEWWLLRVGVRRFARAPT
jgi:hypothetical protein